MRLKFCSTLVISFCSWQLMAQTSLPKTVAAGAQPVLVSSQFAFTEGPAADKKGNIYFTDQPNNAIWKYDTKGKLSLFLDKAGRANGLYFDRKGNLIACADEKDELWLISPKKKVTVLVNNFGNRRLNGPNDVWVAPDGGIFFTDPYYQREYWDRKQPDIKEQRVYYLAPGAKEPVIAAEDFKKPNGIIGTKDGKTVYVADIDGGKIYRYAVGEGGKLVNQEAVTNFTTDGMALDEDGNLYLCGNGIRVINKNGEQIGHIPIPESWTANACFGGKDGKLLFVTAGKSIYTVKMNVKGAE
ncbi:gluconolactonase [Chitinophaga terrae (ex Kim and Jung 2007)]|uniref:Gluconolactonase n=1 Tax=Chitinophaga terrae (ex Kim and Jung 2007) TaxID=408074 RepID=A0A1H4BAC6_9BACT|nr:SMP-30/gluconolactonase/LRE family protein [Chitinophaga terrae (ex Kim and Jung 2007)]MDQ0106259.1 gluconolactonase [Chitinophaga terrae (ex Kim and Jung 2007)]SEA45089.1 gluconolactonase [Chitinophaga terrae (ex Kim and Jung 2007)]